MSGESPDGTAAAVDAAAGTGPALRWAIMIASVDGPVGDRWGDTHFADSLADALRRLGQDVTVLRRSAHASAASRDLDVTVTLRGLTRLVPVAGAVDVLWVISHPDLVTPDELADADLVLAASTSWAERTTARTGVPVEPLLQAVDTTRFGPSVTPRPQRGCVFVGGCPPDRDRQVVVDALAAGVVLTVHGPGWPGRVPDDAVGDPYVANDELCAVYRGSRRVLADHWPDMAAHGFLQNRLFDAVASGCRVVSDPVAGVGEVLAGAVQVYRSRADLARLCSPEGDAAFPDDETMQAIARRVAAEHSFDRRAARLLEVVTEARSRRAGGPAAR